MLRFLVFDEDNLLIRKFHTKDDAINFLQEGWTIKEIPKKKKFEVLKEFQESLGDPPF